MIITKEFAEKLDKETLAELATKYCNELAEKLGGDKKIKIHPGEVICKKEEAEQIFTDLYMRTSVQKERAFIHDNTAYTPLIDPSLEEQVFIFRLTGHDSRKYACLRGFGAEMGHFIARKVYGKYDIGLGEAFDYVSHLYEISTDVKTVCRSEGISDREGLENVLIYESMVNARTRLDAYETLLFDGEDSAIKKLSKICQSEAKNMLAALELDYMTTMHFEGLKLAIAVYDNENEDIDRTYKKIGGLLSNPKVNNVLDALRRLYNPKLDTTFGHLKELLSPNRSLSKYKDVFNCSPFKKMLRLGKNKSKRGN
ncbi:hypothetical protein FJZ53_04555 [Candidatus Woesearchaeota archaeon]|nr:hypothetical protein [Candidatus Woesearchaeota archaeon]